MSDTDELLSMGLDDAKVARQDARLRIDDIDRQILNLRKLKMGYLADIQDIEQHMIVISTNGSDW